MSASITERKRTSFSEFAAERLIKASGAMAILFVFLIFAFLLREGLPAFTEVKLDNLLSTRWYPTEGYYGILPLFFGSLVVTIGAAIIAMPIGLLTAIFIAEIAPRWLREILKPMIEVVAAEHSVGVTQRANGIRPGTSWANFDTERLVGFVIEVMRPVPGTSGRTPALVDGRVEG